ncbi:hypothetical protein SNE40_014416 [Patella caerulea]|uniref:Reverse transcriptase domain-containing protein n=1 Tax=Patella caerulea TaxID=87958 RepID=A0AAN8JI99_PATCE
MIHDMLYDHLVDVLILVETKLDNTFPDAQVGGYRLFRQDRDAYGGGVMVYIRSDLPSRKRTDLKMNKVEAINIEITLDTTKWLLIAAYRPPNMPNSVFTEDFTKTLDRACVFYDNFLIAGDLNYDMNIPDKRKTLLDICNLYDLRNLVKSPTCFMKGFIPSLLDVFITNKVGSFMQTQSFNSGISDWHHIVITIMKGKVKGHNKTKLNYRCYRDLDEDALLNDLRQAPFRVAHVFEDMDDIYWAHDKMVNEIIDKHITIKQKHKRKLSAPFMNGELRRAINHKKALSRKFQRCKTDKNWRLYKCQRNNVTKLKKKAIKEYFMERCSGGPKSKDFWPTIRPFLTNKGSCHDTAITLCENDTIKSDQNNVCNIFNDFYINVANDIGKDSIKIDSEQNFQDHPRIKAIKTSNNQNFSFNPVSEKDVSGFLKQIGDKKATGVDNISVKILKKTESVMIPHITELINTMFIKCTFPQQLKLAKETPVHKTNDQLTKGNFRPVSILTIVSKLFERATSIQLNNHFTDVFHPYLSAFRSGYICQSALVVLTEEWKKAVDENRYIGAILMDLSKAFDCLLHALIIVKLKASGLTDDAVQLLSTYLENRKQCVQIGNHRSTFLEIIKGVPQGSILGPLLFNIFINDIFYLIKESGLYNYAIDNTLSFWHGSFDIMTNTLEKEGSYLVDWFMNNHMQANPDKFQGLAIGKKTYNMKPVFNIKGIDIECTKNVKLLGVDIDYQMNFNTHIGKICRKASKQINVLKRIGKHLPITCRKLIYHSFIMSTFNFCPLVWHNCNSDKLEKLHFRALKFSFQDFNSSYDELISKTGVSTLEIRRMRLLAIKVFKIIAGNRPAYMSQLISVKKSHYSCRYSNLVQVPNVNSEKHGKNSFKFQAAKIWNSLPEHIRTTTKFGLFKKILFTWNGIECKCSMCKPSKSK